MKEWLIFIVEYAVLIIQAMALVIIIIGTIEAFLRSLCAVFSPSAGGSQFRSFYLQYARWLVGGLTFQLAADIIGSSIAPTWDEIGQLAAMAGIRTFLNFFLERDLAEVEQREAKSQGELAKSH